MPRKVNFCTVSLLISLSQKPNSKFSVLRKDKMLHTIETAFKKASHFRAVIDLNWSYKLKFKNAGLTVDLWSSKKGRLRLVYATQLYWNSWSNINLQNENGSFLNIKFFFFGTKMTEENWEKGFSPTDWTSSGRCISLIQKNNLWNLSSLQEHCDTRSV